MTLNANNDIWLWADWPAPKNIHAGTSLRSCGASHAPFHGLNLAQHVGDSESLVSKNREILRTNLKLDSEPVWLNQVHSAKVISIDKLPQNKDADGTITTLNRRTCVVLTADCVPLLFCNESGTKVAAIHAGWRGICGGIIENTIQLLQEPGAVLVWVGPCISQQYYEVGKDVYDACLSHSSLLKRAFQFKNNDHWHCDLTGLVKIILKNNGVGSIYECDLCTYKMENLFYSYRRDGITGRNASMIWIE